MSETPECPACGDQGLTTTLAHLIDEAQKCIVNYGYDVENVCCPQSLHGEAEWAAKVLILSAMIMDLRRQLDGREPMNDWSVPETGGMN